jgi:1,4-dihydroxy-2-naphthoyl-CoA hydrolase
MDPAVMLQSQSTGLALHLGIEIVSATTTRVTGRLQARPEHLNEQGWIHGGAIMSFADTLGAHGANLNLRPGFFTRPLESKTNFFKPGRPGLVSGEAIPLHIGRITMVWQTTVRGVEDDTIAMVTQTQMVLEAPTKAEPAAPPSRVAAETKRGDVATTRHDQIFRAACVVFGRCGFAQATMREVAAEAGMPVPTMYQYIRSKDDLLTLIFDTYMEEVHGSVLKAASKGRTATDKLRNAVKATLTSFDKYHVQIRLMNRETKSLSTDARQRVMRRMQDYTNAYRDLIAEGMANGEFRPSEAELIANFIPLLCDVWPTRYWNVGKFGLPAVQDAILALLIDGLRHREPA